MLDISLGMPNNKSMNTTEWELARNLDEAQRALDNMAELWGLERDPKTGRYVKTGEPIETDSELSRIHSTEYIGIDLEYVGKAIRRDMSRVAENLDLD